MRIVPLLVVLLLHIGSALAEPRMTPTVSVTASYPGTHGSIARSRPLYLRLDYRSEVPIRVRARGYSAGREVVQDVRFNPSPAYPAGQGEAMAWIAYGSAVTLDEIRLEVSDASWRPLLTARMPVSVAWTGEAGAAASEPAWVVRLNAAQQNSMGFSEESDGFDLVLTVLMWGVPAYFVLQIALAYRFSGAWRLAALAPLLVTLPLAIQSMAAFSAGSNLWPILFIFAAPPAALYLAGIAGPRLISRAWADRA